MPVTMEGSFQYLHLDIRTCDPLLKKHVKNCSQQMGYAATSGANDKDDKWIGYTLAQGDIFQAICHEHPGRMGEGAMAALDRAAARFAPTVPQRNAFKTYWLQRLEELRNSSFNKCRFAKETTHYHLSRYLTLSQQQWTWHIQTQGLCLFPPDERPTNQLTQHPNAKQCNQ